MMGATNILLKKKDIKISSKTQKGGLLFKTCHVLLYKTQKKL